MAILFFLKRKQFCLGHTHTHTHTYIYILLLLSFQFFPNAWFRLKLLNEKERGYLMLGGDITPKMRDLKKKITIK